MDDDWRTRLAAELLGEDEVEPISQRMTFAPEGATAMEIALGQARSELTYVLELGRTHHLPVLGAIVGDEIWVRLGESKLSFRLDRDDSSHGPVIHASIAGVDARLTWDPKGRAIVTSQGRAIEMQSYVQAAIDTTVRAFKATQETETKTE